DRQSGREGDVMESLTVALQHDGRFETIHARAAIAEHQVEIAVIIEVAGVAAHGSPAAGKPKVAIAHRERPVAVVVINPKGMSVGWTFAGAHGMDDILMV